MDRIHTADPHSTPPIHHTNVCVAAGMRHGSRITHSTPLPFFHPDKPQKLRTPLSLIATQAIASTACCTYTSATRLDADILKKNDTY